MTKKLKGLSARELLTATFNALKMRLGGKEIKLPSEALAEIANDSDWHRTRVGYTGYESAVLLKVGGREWAVAFGTTCGDYPADRYNCDIAAVRLSGHGKSKKQIAEEIRQALEGNSYFRGSLIYAMADGNLAGSSRSRFTRKVLEVLQPRIRSFIAQDIKADPDYITGDLQPLVISAVRYKKEFAAFLSDTLQTVLAQGTERGE